ncbi:MAG TPA: YIP1 family protein [Thermoanaerobaculia bacterium]
MSTYEPAVPPPPPPPASVLTDSSLGRLVGVLVSPVQTFRSIARRPTWIAPLLVLAILGCGLGVLVAQRIDYSESVRKRMEQQGVKASDEQVERSMQLIKKFAPYGAAGFALVVFPALYLLVAAVFWVAFKMVGGETSYKTSLSVLLHGSLPTGIAALAAIPIVWGRASLSPEEMQRTGGVLLSSAAAFAPEGAGPALLALLGSLDVFIFWCLVLWVIGYQEATGVSRKLSASVVVILWVLFVAGKVGFRVLAASFGG